MSLLSLPLDQWPLYKATTDLRVVLYDRKGFINGPPHPIDIFKYLYNIKREYVTCVITAKIYNFMPFRIFQ